MHLWLNGRLKSSDDTGLDPADRGLLLGDGLFETMRRRARGASLCLPAICAPA